MHQSHQAGRPFYVYLPYSQVHCPPIPDPEYAGKTKNGGLADLLTQMDDFAGQILDTLGRLGTADDTIVVRTWVRRRTCLDLAGTPARWRPARHSSAGEDRSLVRDETEQRDEHPPCHPLNDRLRLLTSILLHLGRHIFRHRVSL